MNSRLRPSMVGVLMAIAVVVPSAAPADDVVQYRVVPTLEVALPFGAQGVHGLSLGLAAQLGRSPVHDRWANTPLAPSSPSGLDLDGARELSIVRFGGESAGLGGVTVLGHRLQNSGEAGAGGHSSGWVWWTLGGVAVAAGAALAVAGGGHHSDNQSGGANVSTVCGNNDVVLGNNCVASTGH